MGIFDPKTDTSVAYEQPVQQPQSLGMALADVGTKIVGGVLETRYGDRSGGGKSNDAFAISQFQKEIEAAEAVRSSNPERADRLERNALVNAQKNGLTYNENLKAAYTALTGRQGDELLFSQEELLEKQVMESPEYQSALVATYKTNPDASFERRQELAMSRVARQQGQKAILMDQNIAWTEGKRDALFSEVNDFEADYLGALVLMQKTSGYADLQQIRQARAFWNQKKAELLTMRPEGVSNDQWSQFEARMGQTEEIFDTLEEMSTEEGISALAAAELAKGIQQKEDWSPGQKLIAKQYFNDGLATGAILPTEVRDIVGSLIYEDFEAGTGTTTGYDEEGNPQTDMLPKSVTDTLSAEDAFTSFDRAKNIAKLVGTGNTSKVTSDPTYRSDFFKTTQVAFAAMNKIGTENRRFVTADGVAEVFNGKIVEGIRAAGVQDPVRARATAQMGFEALDNQFAIASTQLSNSLQGTVLRLDPQGGLVLNREELLSRTTPEMFSRIEQAAEESYNGDVLALLKDRGMRARMVPVEGGGFRQATAIDLPPEVYEGLGDLQTIRGQLRSVKAIQNKRNEFATLRDEFTQETEATDVANQAVASTQVRGFDLVADDTEFLGEVDRVSGNLGIQPVDLLKAISFETVGTFKPDIKNPGSSATGLIQFIESTAKGLGTSTAELRNMSRAEQMQYVERYLEPFKGRLNNLGDIYMAIHWPAGVGKDSSYVMYERGTEEYEKNRNLDMNGDGTVTRGEAVARVVNSNRGGTSATGMPASQDVQTTTIPDSTEPQNGGTPTAPAVEMPAPTAEAPATDMTEPQATEESAAPSEGEAQDSGRRLNEQQTARVLSILRSQGIDTDAISSFNSVEDVQRAIDNGTLKEGDLYEINGEIEVVEGA